jgi:hypothetical protein
VPYQFTLYELLNEQASLKLAGVGLYPVVAVIMLSLLLGFVAFKGK